MMLIPRETPSRRWRRFFQFPVLLYRLGLGFFISRSVLLLTSKGRKTGRPRVAAVGFVRHPQSGTLYLTAGWKGESHWYKNVMANPRVHVRLGRHRFEGIVARASEPDAVSVIQEYNRRNPFGPRIWERWTRRRFEDSPAGLRAVLEHFPVLELRRTTPRPLRGD